jgi:hypothetical protein
MAHGSKRTITAHGSKRQTTTNSKRGMTSRYRRRMVVLLKQNAWRKENGDNNA